MTRLTVAQRAEQSEAVEKLRNILTPGDTVYTVLRHVSRSGMQRHIDLYKIDGSGEPFWLTGLAAKALDWRRTDQGYLKVDGCGMDIGFHAVYSLSRTLYPDGFGCIGTEHERYADRCPSNDHSNYRMRDGEYAASKCPIHHDDGGYALRHRWL